MRDCRTHVKLLWELRGCQGALSGGFGQQDWAQSLKGKKALSRRAWSSLMFLFPVLHPTSNQRPPAVYVLYLKVTASDLTRGCKQEPIQYMAQYDVMYYMVL